MARRACLWLSYLRLYQVTYIYIKLPISISKLPTTMSCYLHLSELPHLSLSYLRLRVSYQVSAVVERDAAPHEHVDEAARRGHEQVAAAL